MSESTNTADTPEETPRGWAEVMADAIAVLTEAGRLRRPVHEEIDGEWRPSPTRTEPTDWAEFVTLALAGAAANIGGVEKVLAGRPGSWEADGVRSLLRSTVGDDPAQLLAHRTEPVRVVLRPAEWLSDFGYGAVYDASMQVIGAEERGHLWEYQRTEDGQWVPIDPAAPPLPGNTAQGEEWRNDTLLRVTRTPADEEALERLGELEDAVDDLEKKSDVSAYGEALRAAATARVNEFFPGVDVEISVDLDHRAASDPSYDDWDGIEEPFLEAIRVGTPLPWSGLAPKDYPLNPADIVEVERSAGRLPHQRVADAVTNDAESGETS